MVLIMNISSKGITDKTFLFACLLQVKHGCEASFLPAAYYLGDHRLRANR